MGRRPARRPRVLTLLAAAALALGLATAAPSATAQPAPSQPWQGYLETRSGRAFLDGVGTSWHFPAGTDIEPAMALLADIGIRALRIEIPWMAMAWPGDELDGERARRATSMLEAARHEGIRPLILLNANHGFPTPALQSIVVVQAGGAAGSRQLVLESVDGLVAGRSGISNITEPWMAEVLFSSIDAVTRTVGLSRPLPIAIADGTPVSIATLAFEPLHPPGGPELDDTIDGWVHYADVVAGLVEAAGIESYDIEIWNELSFGSRFLDIANYDDRFEPLGAARFRTGGSAWLLAAATAAMLEERHPGATVLWGFSNTDFFTTPVGELPPGIDGQTFHPYDTAPEPLPDGSVRVMPEGDEHLGLVPRTLMSERFSPAARTALPNGFVMAFTEHGVVPRQAGITTVEESYDYKARAALRIFTFWLNKGPSRVYLSTAYKEDPLQGGLVPTDVPPSEYGARSRDHLMTAPMLAIQRLTDAFNGAEELTDVRQLGVDFDGPSDLLAVLPFQVTESRFVLPVYVMTSDLTQRLPEQPYQLTLHGLATAEVEVTATDPLTGADVPVEDMAVAGDTVTFTLRATDTPRLVLIDESPSEPRPTWMPVAAAVAAIVVAFGVLRVARRAGGAR